MRYEDPEFRAACREVYATIPDSLDFRIVRAAVGNYWDEFEGSKRDDWQDQAKHRRQLRHQPVLLGHSIRQT